MINILTFNEWKESDDYNIQQWFVNKKITIEQWFDESSLSELEFDYFEFDNTNSLFDLYSAELYFHEDTVQYILQFMINPENIVDGKIDEVKLVLKGFDVDTQQFYGSTDRTVDEPELSPDLLVELINEFKIEFIKDDEEPK